MGLETNNIIKKLEEKKQVTKNGTEFWMGRELQEILGYDTWRRFEDTVKRAIEACDSSVGDSANHFASTVNMVDIGSGGKRQVQDYFLTRYACYLIAMNGDSSKPEIGFAQTYFAIQTRRQELDDRLRIRERVVVNNKKLTRAAARSGVINFKFFQAAGIRALYGGLGVSQIKARKGIPEKEDILDCSGTDELTFNDFRIVLTKQQLENNGIYGQGPAEKTHESTGETVRKAIKEAHGTMPEDLKAQPSIKKELGRRKRLAAKAKLPKQT